MQRVEHPRGLHLHQAARQLLPHPFGDQRIDLAGVHHVLHQRLRFGGDLEINEARRKPRHPQDAHRVLGEGGRHMAQQPGLQIALPAIRVDDRAGLILRHRVDRQVAALQIFFQRHARIGVEDEAVIARSGLALGAGEGVLLLRGRVQKNRKVAAHRQVAGGAHRLRRRAGDDPIDIAVRPP